MKFFFCFLLFLTLAVFCKIDVQYKYFIQKKLYQDTIDFSKFIKFYNHYLGGIFPLQNFSPLQNSYVFGEKIVYQNISPYLDGAKLTVSSHYLVPVNFRGVVIYVGKKDDYGKVIILKNEEGIDIWYGNICNSMVKLYDHVESGEYLGEVCEDTLYLVYSKGNKFLNYHDYLS